VQFAGELIFRNQAAGNRQQRTGNREQAIENRQQKTGGMTYLHGKSGKENLRFQYF
jgi:hypothetical protein